jgi:hypothetical protein
VRSSGESFFLERRIEGERLSKRNDVRSRVSSEDTRICGIMVREDEV